MASKTITIAVPQVHNWRTTLAGVAVAFGIIGSHPEMLKVPNIFTVAHFVSLWMMAAAAAAGGAAAKDSANKPAVKTVPASAASAASSGGVVTDPSPASVSAPVTEGPDPPDDAPPDLVMPANPLPPHW